MFGVISVAPASESPACPSATAQKDQRYLHEGCGSSWGSRRPDRQSGDIGRFDRVAATISSCRAEWWH